MDKYLLPFECKFIEASLYNPNVEIVCFNKDDLDKGQDFFEIDFARIIKCPKCNSSLKQIDGFSNNILSCTECGKTWIIKFILEKSPGQYAAGDDPISFVSDINNAWTYNPNWGIDMYDRLPDAIRNTGLQDLNKAIRCILEEYLGECYNENNAL